MSTFIHNNNVSLIFDLFKKLLYYNDALQSFTEFNRPRVSK